MPDVFVPLLTPAAGVAALSAAASLPEFLVLAPIINVAVPECSAAIVLESTPLTLCTKLAPTPPEFATLMVPAAVATGALMSASPFVQSRDARSVATDTPAESRSADDAICARTSTV